MAGDLSILKLVRKMRWTTVAETESQIVIKERKSSRKIHTLPEVPSYEFIKLHGVIKYHQEGGLL